MGHWHFWTTPEEAGEQQPLETKTPPLKLVLDGRIDNREEMFSKLNMAPAVGKSTSDAALMLLAYSRWQVDCFKQIIGEYALVIFDEQNQKIICARDPLGDRTLFYSFHNSQLLIASEPWPIAHATHIELDETGAAHHFALKAAQNGQSMFKNIYELLPAHILEATSTDYRTWRYWQPDTEKKIRYKTDEEYAEHFRNLLKESIRCRLRSITPAGILMSGGMDSPSIASLAAQMLAPAQVTTLTHIFNDAELKECDERTYVEDIKQKCNLNTVYIPCDDAWVLKDNENLPINKNSPDINAYRWMKEREYTRAQAEGLHVLLTGSFGDHLYSAGMDWLADMLEEGRLLTAIKKIIALVYHFPNWKTHWHSGYLHRAARRILNKLPGGKKIHQKNMHPGWLTTQAANTLTSASAEYSSAPLGLGAAKICTTEAYFASRYQVELRHPYRDRRLVEFVLALPASQLFQGGVHKYILRIAMKNLLPQSVLTPRRTTSLKDFFMRGMKHEKDFIQKSLENPRSDWRSYVKKDWVMQCWKNLQPDEHKSDVLIPWMLISYETWHKALKVTP